APARLPALFFRGSRAHHGAGVLAHAGRVRWARTALRERNDRYQPRQLRALLHRFHIRTDIPEIGLVRVADHLVLPLACVSAGYAHRQEREKASRSAPAPGDTSLLEQFPYSSLCLVDHSRS